MPTFWPICSRFLDPFAQMFGLDGVILMAFILGFPANEIVIPLIIMAYMANGSLLDMNNLSELKSLLVDNGWTWLTAAVYHALLPHALALLHHLSYHKERNPKLEMDRCVRASSYGNGAVHLLPAHHLCSDDRFGLTADDGIKTTRRTGGLTQAL